MAPMATWANSLLERRRRERRKERQNKIARYEMAATTHYTFRQSCKKGRTNMALILYPDGTSKEVHPANGDHFEIEELMQIVEGTIQLIPLPDGRIMTLNEEGGPDAEARRAGLPPNEQATALAGFPFNKGPLATLRGLGVESPAYSVGPLDLAYIPGTV